jgi:mycoredoxin
VTLYWRPYCPYCMRLRRQVRKARLTVREINIWKDAEGAARVREITGGDETVPTVTIGTTALVNPSIAKLLAAVEGQAHLLARSSVPAGSARNVPGNRAKRGADAGSAAAQPVVHHVAELLHR